MTTMTCDEIRDLAPAYVLGALERVVEHDVAEHVRTCADAHAEMEELGGVVPYLDETIPLVEPPARLRDRIMAAAAEDLAARQARRVAPEPPVVTRTEPPDPGNRVVSIDAARSRRRDLRTWALGIAAVLAIVALGAFNVVTQQELSTARSYQARLAAALAQAGQPGSQVAVLASTGAPGSGPGGIAVMPATGNGTLVVTGLAPTTGSQVYEAWAIVDGHPPAPVAGFTVGADGIGYFDRMPNATGETLTVAITLEPRPNPTAPSAAPIAAGVAVPPTAAG
ncbi:MAG: hypothetical protein QOF49_1677 [Chloroflexota bacterium]|nr:hypothetical protein [Chloroflexota bacterium]